MIQEGDILLVEVPEGQQYFDLYGNLQQGQEVVYSKMTVPGKFKQISIPLPPGDYDLIGKASEIAEKDLTEDEWQQIAKSMSANNLTPNTTIILKKKS